MRADDSSEIGDYFKLPQQDAVQYIFSIEKIKKMEENTICDCVPLWLCCSF